MELMPKLLGKDLSHRYSSIETEIAESLPKKTSENSIYDYTPFQSLREYCNLLPLCISFQLLFVGILLCLLISPQIFLRSEISSSNSIVYPINETCNPGIFNDPSQLSFDYWKPNSDLSYQFPIYWTHPLDQRSETVEQAIIVQHGNLRNANDYFCAAITSYQQAVEEEIRQEYSLDSMEEIDFSLFDFYYQKTIILAPQFLIDKDLCWQPLSRELIQVNVLQLQETCQNMIWSSEGWKDGHLPLNFNDFINSANNANNNNNNNNNDSGNDGDSNEIVQYFYSYDVFNSIINRLIDVNYFPQLKKITLFGFSAGGQTVLRYSLWPSHHLASIENEQYLSKKQGKQEYPQRNQQQQEEVQQAMIDIKYVVGDVSTYLYIDNQRPFNNGSHGFGVPNPSWLLSSPTSDSTSTATDSAARWPWIGVDWYNSSCSEYNSWRYGFNELQGYYQHHAKYSFQSNEQAFANAVKESKWWYLII
jgi:hypothetical protein